MPEEHQKCDNRILEQEVRHGFDKINHTVGDIKYDVKQANADTLTGVQRNTEEHNAITVDVQELKREMTRQMQDNMRKLEAINTKISTMYIYAGALITILGAVAVYGRVF